MKLSVLVIDDEQMFRLLAEQAMAAEGYEVRGVATLAQARAAMQQAAPDVLLLDRRLPDGDGITFLRELRDSGNTYCLVMVVTAHGDMENAVEALRAGAADYLTKPLQLPDLVVKLQRLLETRLLRERLALAQSTNTQVPHVPAHGAKRQQVEARLRSVAQSAVTPVLLAGPSGVGKQYAAELLHRLTYEATPEAPFVEVNCATLPSDSLETELFGHEGGTLSHSQFARRGLIEIADGGTLFLDEISEMPLRAQAKLLKFLDAWRFRRTGGQRELAVTLRVVAATHQDLVGMVARGQFREDLFHRLAVFWVELPRLAECPEDIDPLADAFVRYFGARIKKRLRGLTEAARRALHGYRYPGNVRELRNVIERAVILTEGPDLGEADIVLPAPTAPPRPAGDGFFVADLGDGEVPLRLDAVERQYVARVLRHFKGHRTAAAEALGISYPTFLKRLREMGIAGTEPG